MTDGKNLFDLTGHTALVTGGGYGLGTDSCTASPRTVRPSSASRAQRGRACGDVLGARGPASPHRR